MARESAQSSERVERALLQADKRTTSTWLSRRLKLLICEPSLDCVRLTDQVGLGDVIVNRMRYHVAAHSSIL